MTPHMIQYAYVGNRFVGHTEQMSDDEVQKAARLVGRVDRFNRCPECEVWTTENGRLRTEPNCPLDFILGNS